jgi:hypothetical protein
MILPNMNASTILVAFKKLDQKSMKGYLVEHESTDIYRVYHPNTNVIKISHDVIFCEDKFINKRCQVY